MTTVFKPIRPKKISEEIVGQIKELITKGELGPGQKIPSERDLATMLGVSRPSVREAIMVLEAMGLVESRQGGGTFVRSLGQETITDPLSRLVEGDPRLQKSLTEVRMGLETWSAYLAASRATDDEIAEMKSLYATMEAQAASGGWDPDVDARLHYSITAATHNTLQLHILESIRAVFQSTIHDALIEFYRREGYVDLLLRHHRQIVEAIADRDPEGARTAMIEHLRFVEEKFIQVQTEHDARG